MLKSNFNVLSPFKSMKRTVFYCFAFLIVIILLIFYIISIRYTEKTVLNNSINNKMKLVKQVSRDIDAYIYSMENISEMIVQGGDVQEYLFGDSSTAEKNGLYNQIMTQYNTVLKTRDDIYNIGVVTSERKCIINDGTDGLNENVSLSDVEWYTQAIESNENILTTTHVQNVIHNNYKWVVTLSRGIINPDTGHNEGVLFLDLNYKVMKDLCENNSLSSSSYVFIIDEQGKIVYHPKQQFLYSGLAKEEIGQVLSSDSNYFIADDEAGGRLYAISKLEKTGWRVVGVASLSDLMKDKREAQGIYLILTAILLCAGVVFSYFVIKTAARPIGDLLEQRSSGKRVPIKQEVEYARSYLMVQRSNYKNKQEYKGKLEYEITIEPDIEQEMILNFIIQPLVENAVVHGIRNYDYTGIIRIIGYSQDGNIILKVIDNGVGMEQETLDSIFDTYGNIKEDKVGIYGVQTRIQKYYGKDYGLHIESTPEEGTTVTLTIPKGFIGEVHNEKI